MHNAITDSDGLATCQFDWRERWGANICLASNLNYFFLSDSILFYTSVTDPYTFGFW